MQANMGMAGEFRCVVKRADGSKKLDTGYQKNLILNQGLDFFGGGQGSQILQYCVIGSGNSQPSYTQNKLDNAVVGVVGSAFSSKTDYDAARDGNLYKTNRVLKYLFSGLNNVNISEVGLASNYSDSAAYYLCTRALIKDSSGNPTTITVLSGEILEIYYKLWAVFDITDKTGQVNLLDGVGGNIAYNYKTRLANVGSSGFQAGYYITLNSSNSASIHYSAGVDLSAITAAPSGNSVAISNYTENSYQKGSYKKVFTLNFNIAIANDKNRVLFMSFAGFYWQIRFGSVADDSPINKTSTQTLAIPVEVSWSRYEGAL